jgi:hypothetical protein
MVEQVYDQNDNDRNNLFPFTVYIICSTDFLSNTNPSERFI